MLGSPAGIRGPVLLWHIAQVYVLRILRQPCVQVCEALMMDWSSGEASVVFSYPPVDDAAYFSFP